VHAVLWLPLVIGLAPGLLQPIKGFIVAMQWQMGMRGFAASRLARNWKDETPQTQKRRKLQASAVQNHEAATRFSPGGP
jgi:hypothetical protein